MRLEGEGSDDFEIIDNEKIKVANPLDYDSKPVYNLVVVATDNNAKEYNSTLTINVTNDSNRTMEFRQKELLEKLSLRGEFKDYIEFLYLNNDNPAKFSIVEGLDSKFFETEDMRYNNNNDSYISNYNWLYVKNSSNLSYLNKQDANGDGIYEVNITATDVQTLESTSMVLKYKLVSSYFDINNYYDERILGRESENSFDINQETVIGGNVPYSIIRFDTAKDVNITDVHLEGEGNEDFNITDNTITVVNSLDASAKNNYNLKVVSTDTTGYSNEQNISINVNEGQTHNEFNITNRDELKVNRFMVDWDNWWFSNSINSNNIAKMKFLDNDAFVAVDMEHFNRYSNHHDNYFYFYKKDYYYNDENRPSYLNPKDSNGDNIYEFRAELTDIQTLEKQTVNYKWEVLSHQVQPYWAYLQDSYSNYQPYRYRNNVEVNLSIPTEAPIGGELLDKDGAKGFYLALGRDISFDTASLEGADADKFEIVGQNTIKLKEKVAKGDYNLTLVITDNEAQESRNPLYIHVGSIHDAGSNRINKLSSNNPSRKLFKSAKPVNKPYPSRERLRYSDREKLRYELERRRRIEEEIE
ncbi:Cadherin domain protein [hydrothermal vent metagenome]|uniref:Cadherin domain protein n=1 Tax=hydrothermal vent metagenome TaxID=652676 RepID=A0A1W1C8X7_9ZZZZ